MPDVIWWSFYTNIYHIVRVMFVHVRSVNECVDSGVNSDTCDVSTV